MNNIFENINKQIKTQFPDRNKLEIGLISLYAIDYIFNSNRFNSTLYDFNHIKQFDDKLSLRFISNEKNNIFDIFSFRTHKTENKLPTFIRDEHYHQIQELKKIINENELESEYLTQITTLKNNFPEIISIFKNYKTIISKNSDVNWDDVFRNKNKKNGLFKHFMSNSTSNLEELKAIEFNENIFPISKIEKYFRNEIFFIKNYLHNQYPKLFLSKSEIIKNAKIQHIHLKQGEVDIIENNNLKRSLLDNFYELERNIPLKDLGIDFLKNALNLHQGKSNSYFIFLISEDKELLGGISYSNQNDSIINNIDYTFSNIKYRGLGVATKLYEILAQETIMKNHIICNAFYTDNGKSFIPRIKEKLSIQHKNLISLDLDYSPKNEEPSSYEYIISDFNSEYKKMILEIEEEQSEADKKNLLQCIIEDYQKSLSLIKSKNNECYISDIVEQSLENISKKLNDRKLIKSLKKQKITR